MTDLDPLEILAVVTGALSTWWLARNRALGWWIGLVSVVAFAVVFLRVRLYADIGIQAYYFVTSIQALYVWRFGGRGRTERPVGRASRPLVLFTVPAAVICVFALRAVLVELNGAAPFWDAVATVLAIVAQVYLMRRWVQSWYLWIAADLIYIPLYASRNLWLTSVLYVAFGLMSAMGLVTFRRALASQARPAEAAA